MPTDPPSVRWTLDALDKAQQLGFARRDVESALLEGHRERRRNKGQARWLVDAGRALREDAAVRQELEPDPRLMFANERTLLAWNRTALGVVAGGLAAAQYLKLGYTPCA